jgi:hypothetical protein
MGDEIGTKARHEMLFVHLIALFQSAAMQQMGKLPNPLTNEIERDLEQSKLSIDILDMLKEKTKGNLSATEADFLDKLLFELHMNFVDESGKPAETDKPAEADKSAAAEQAVDGSGEAKEKGGETAGE